ncbi:hypothetical protein FF38_14541 [Lucilia cuprina]|uniref:Uncharacterized protein n=1 Tax=Lucilia cuprina TaxID=7375 RepID=A0A0L0CIH0_LUCCU|nr:hypothetical protein FF38_14541 [Lucilia cuprina]
MLNPVKVRTITCALHNFLMSRKSSVYLNAKLVDHYNEDGTLVNGAMIPTANLYQTFYHTAHTLAKKLQ